MSNDETAWVELDSDGEEVLLNRRIPMVELGEIRNVPPAGITTVIASARIRIDRPSMHLEPVAVRG